MTTEEPRTCLVIIPHNTGMIDDLADQFLDHLDTHDTALLNRLLAANKAEYAVIEIFDNMMVVTAPQSLVQNLLGCLDDHPMESVQEAYEAALKEHVGAPTNIHHIALPWGFRDYEIKKIRQSHPELVASAETVLDALTGYLVDGNGYYRASNINPDRIIAPLNAERGTKLMHYAFGLIEDEAARTTLMEEMGFGKQAFS